MLKSYAFVSAETTNKIAEILNEAAEISADYSDFLHSFSVQVDSSVLVLGEGDEAKDFADFLQKEGYEAGVISPYDVISVSGHLGAFEAQVKVGGNLGKIHFSQIVLFYEDPHLIRFAGCESAGEYDSPQELLDALNSRLGQFKYHAPVHYDDRFCQYHLRRPDESGEGWCHRCVDECPSFGVSKDDSLMQLKFSALDCIACGKCVMVCPSGAIKRDGFSLEAAQKIAKLYFGITPVVMNSQIESDLEGLEIKEQLIKTMLDSNALALFTPQVHALNETYLLTLMQESAKQVVLFDISKDKLLEESVGMVNGITQAIFGIDGVLLAHSYDELIAAIKKTKDLDVKIDWHYTYAQDDNEALYQVFSQRLLSMVRGGDFGKLKARDHGRIIVDSNKCTLCLSCVGACNVGALSSSEFSLFHHPSLCTTCGYCMPSCPEKAISTDFGGIALNETFLQKNEVAKSEGFKCVECGKIFASSKSVEKIAAIMAPIFSGDEARLRSLQCCDTCKVKVMFGVS